VDTDLPAARLPVTDDATAHLHLFDTGFGDFSMMVLSGGCGHPLLQQTLDDMRQNVATHRRGKVTALTGPSVLKAAFHKLYNVTSRTLAKGVHFAGTPHALTYTRTAHTGYGAGTKLSCYGDALKEMNRTYWRAKGEVHF
jgi:hypothetical protein